MKYFTNKKKIFIFFLLYFHILSNNAYAYLDPGSVNIFFQIAAGLLSSFFLLLSSVNNFIKSVLEKKTVNTIILVFFSIFPIWIFKSSFDLNFIFIYFLLIFCFPLLLILFILRNVSNYYESNKLTNTQIFIISSLVIYGVDQYIGLWALVNYFLPRDKGLYIAAIFLIISLFLIIFYIIKISRFKYIFMLLVVTFSYNLISQDKNLNNLDTKISFNYYANSNTNINRSNSDVKPVLFIVLDEMNGIGGLDADIENYEKAKKSYLDLVNNHKFKIYPNSYTIFSTTAQSVPRMLNFDYSITNFNNSDYTADHEVYFFWKKLKKNKLFDSYEDKKIYVKQTRSIDYCNNINVVRCDTFNPLNKKIFEEINYKNPFLSEFISKFSYQNSIFARFLSRFLAEIDLVNISTSPRSDKAYFEKDLSELFEVIKNEKYDLYFAHFLVPHKPFGFDQNCNYKNFPILNKTIDFMKIQHNQEIYCTNLFLKNFMQKITQLENYNDLKIIIVSDHGARNSYEPKDFFSVVALVKNLTNKPIIDEKIISVQKIVSEFFNQNESNNIDHKKYYDYDSNSFKIINFN